MAWPLSQDYNEAIQNPSTCFTDAELRQGKAVCNALGLPQPCSGNFADVYAVQAGSKKWAVKCFTRQIPGLQQRYAHISSYLRQVNLPFMVEFSFLEKGIQVRGTWYPVLKMQWVEGFALNAFVRDNLDKPQLLHALCQIWLKMATRLREANLAHCDLQHGNVLLVPGKVGALSVRLVDYDGMCVPALELLKSIELGHANYQHPQRLREGSYGQHIDRFPHLVIYTAIRALSLGGKGLWDRFDTGDNLLFTQKDFQSPRSSELFKALVQIDDAEVRQLAQAVSIASQKPIEQVPLLEELVGQTAVTTPARPSNVLAGIPFAAPVSASTRRKGGKRGRRSPVGCAFAFLLSAAAIAGASLFLLHERDAEHAIAQPDSHAVVSASPSASDQRSRTSPASSPPSTSTTARLASLTSSQASSRREPSKSASTKSEPVVKQPATKPEPKVETVPQPKLETKPEPKLDAKPEPKVDPPPAPKDPRTAVPDAAAQAKAESLIKELYKDSFAQRDTANQLALARKLLEQAQQTKDDAAARYVLLREARDLAAQNGDVGLALQVVDALGTFAVDPFEVKVTTLERVAKGTATPSAKRDLLEVTLASIENAFVTEQFDQAARLLKVAEATSAGLSNVPSVKQVAVYATELGSLRQTHAKTQAALVVLQSRPDDSAALEQIGRTACFLTGRWSQGIVSLARAKDSKLQAVAKQDIADPKEPMAQAEVGDGWWEHAQAEQGRVRTVMLWRAHHWYVRAEPGLAGLHKTRIQKRVADLEQVPGVIDRERRAAERALQLGGRVNIFLKDRGTVVEVSDRKQLPATAIRVDALNLMGSKEANDVVLQELLNGLEGLRVLLLKDTPISDAGLVALRPHRMLEALQLDHTRVTDAGLEHVRTMEGLQHLGLQELPITDAGLARLAGMKSLQGLSVDRTKITNAGMAHLQPLPNLMYLGLGHNGLTDAALGPFRNNMLALGLSRRWPPARGRVDFLTTRVPGLSPEEDRGLLANGILPTSLAHLAIDESPPFFFLKRPVHFDQGGVQFLVSRLLLESFGVDEPSAPILAQGVDLR
jgi:hypothetical protein